MGIDVKAKIAELVEKAKKDENFKKELTKDPVKAVEGVLGIDLPDDQVKKIADVVKSVPYESIFRRGTIEEGVVYDEDKNPVDLTHTKLEVYFEPSDAKLSEIENGCRQYGCPEEYDY